MESVFLLIPFVLYNFGPCKQGEKIGCYRLIGSSIFGGVSSCDSCSFFFYVHLVPECLPAIYQPPRNYRLSGKAIVTGRNRCCASEDTQVLGLGVGDAILQVPYFILQLDVLFAELIY